MSVERRRCCLIALAMVGLSVGGVHAQRYTPFIEPFAFDPDYQFFAPAVTQEYGGDWVPANTGWFFEYSRWYAYVTRPEDEAFAEQTNGDFTWGNRYDLGYMTDADHGWLFSGMHIDGPTANDLLPEEPDAAAAEEEEEEPDPDAQVTQNFVTQSINVADLTGFEVNKTFRSKRYAHGCLLEPFLGFRYAKFRDFRRRDTLPTPPLDGEEEEPPEDEVTTSDRSKWVNHMVGGQLGLRSFLQIKSWILSSEVRAFGLQNFQAFENVTELETTPFDEEGEAGDVTNQRLRASAHDGEIVVGAEVRAKAAFALTRDISLQFGVDVLHFARGIARGNNPVLNDQDLTMVGATFGVEVNR